MNKVSCLHCKKSFLLGPFSTHIKFLLKYSANPKTCLGCNTQIPFHEKDKKKFCSQSCAASFNNKRRKPKIKKEKYCLYCRRVLIKTQKKYCSIRCQTDCTYSTFISDWLNNKIDGGISYGYVSDHVRKYLISLKGEQCWQCGWKEIHPVTGNIPIHVDHIDGNCRNNKIDNLRILCPNCHSLTSTFGALNKKGRGIGTMRKP